MKLQNISTVGICTVGLLLLGPLTTFGYYTTAQSAQRITPNTALYTITYTFGFAEKDVYLPVTTQRGLAFRDGNKTNSVGYSFTPGLNGNSENGASAGIVLSSEPIVDNMYKVEAGHRGTFTLVTLLSMNDTEPMAKYALQVDKLPFIFEFQDGTRAYNELTNNELARYSTKKVGLNKIE